MTYNPSNKTTKEILDVLADVFPGYSISDDNNNGAIIETATPYVKHESFNATVEVLVPKNLFNMRIILEFFLIFIDGSQRIFLTLKMKKPEVFMPEHHFISLRIL